MNKQYRIERQNLRIIRQKTKRASWIHRETYENRPGIEYHLETNNNRWNVIFSGVPYHNGVTWEITVKTDDKVENTWTISQFSHGLLNNTVYWDEKWKNAYTNLYYFLLNQAKLYAEKEQKQKAAQEALEKAKKQKQAELQLLTIQKKLKQL